MEPSSTDYSWVSSYPAFCLTFTRARTAPEVLAAYRADPAQATVRTRQQLNDQGVTSEHGSVLRVGILNEWAFCFEEGDPEGGKPGVLDRLSAGTDTIAFVHGADATNFFHHLRDGRHLESFEPGHRGTERGEERLFSRIVQDLRATEPRPSSVVATLSAIATHLDAVINRELLEGPLLTAFLPDQDREPHDHTPSPPSNGSRRSGRSLGALHPDPQPPRPF